MRLRETHTICWATRVTTMRKKQQQRSMSDAYEVFLGELVFSPNDPRVDIVENFDLACDPQFMDWLNKKVDSRRPPSATCTG